VSLELEHEHLEPRLLATAEDVVRAARRVGESVAGECSHRGLHPSAAHALEDHVEHDPPVEPLDAEYPVRLTTGRRLDSFNTGVQSGGYTSPLRRGETLDISREDAVRYGVENGDRVVVTSRRGSIVIPVRIDSGLRAGLAFTTFHYNDEIATNLLTIDVTDPKSGTAEFKACAVRIETMPS